MCGLIGAGGEVPGLKLRRDLAEAALAAVAAPMGLSVDDFAWRAVDVAQSKIARTLTTVVSRQGYDIRDCTMVAYGGGGPIHAGPLAARIGITRGGRPAHGSGFLGARMLPGGGWGGAVRTYRCLLADQSLPVLCDIADDLVAREVERLGEQQERVDAMRWLELRYLCNRTPSSRSHGRAQ